MITIFFNYNYPVVDVNKKDIGGQKGKFITNSLQSRIICDKKNYLPAPD
jgi:hypothetical protein